MKDQRQGKCICTNAIRSRAQIFGNAAQTEKCDRDSGSVEETLPKSVVANPPDAMLGYLARPGGLQNRNDCLEA